MDTRRILPLLILVLLVGVPLSGCMGGADEENGEGAGSGGDGDGTQDGDDEDPPEPGRIVGQVMDYQGGLEGATVTLSRGGGSTVTDSEGYFEFQEVPAGTYQVDARAEYYHRASQPLDLRPGQEKQINFDLDLQMMHGEVPRKYGEIVSFVATDDILFASAGLPLLGGPVVTTTNKTMNNTFPGFWEIEPEPGWLVAQLDVLVAWFYLDEDQPRSELAIRFFRGESPVENEIAEGEATQYHAPEPVIEQELVRYYQLENDDWLSWGDRTWQVGVVAEETEELLPGGAGVLHVVQVIGVLVDEEYAKNR